MLSVVRHADENPPASSDKLRRRVMLPRLGSAVPFGLNGASATDNSNRKQFAFGVLYIWHHISRISPRSQTIRAANHFASRNSIGRLEIRSGIVTWRVDRSDRGRSVLRQVG